MVDTIRKRAVDSLIAAIKGNVSGFNDSNVRSGLALSVDAGNTDRAMFYGMTSGSKESAQHPTADERVSLRVVLVYRGRSELADDALDEMLADVESAALIAPQRGGLSHYTTLRGWEIPLGQESDAEFVATMDFELRVRRRENDARRAGA